MTLTPQQLAELEKKIRELVPELGRWTTYHDGFVRTKIINLEHCREAILRHRTKTDSFIPTEEQQDAWLRVWHGLWVNWVNLKPWESQHEAQLFLYDYLLTPEK